MEAGHKRVDNPELGGKSKSIVSAMSLSSLPVSEEVSTEEISAVEAVLRHIDQSQLKSHFFAGVANWFLVLKMFKELEVAYTFSKDRKPFSGRHRALLTMVLGFGECLSTESESVSEQDFKKAGYTKSILAANVRYLRDKYEQWFSPVDISEVGRVAGVIQDARASTPA